MPAPAVDAELVAAAQAGDDAAFGRLFDAWFDAVFDHASRILRDRDLAGEVAQDTFLAAWQRLGTLADPQAFGGWLLRIARNRALDRLEKERRATPVDAEGFAVIEAEQAAAGAGPLVEDRVATTRDPVRAAEDVELAELLWGAAEALGERDAGVLDLHLRHGLGATEIAGVLGVTPNNAHQMLFRLRSRLGGAVRARVLWRRGRPVCGGLAQALEVNGVSRFDATAVRVIETHADVCDDCEERRRTKLEPAVLFSAVPILVAPVLLKAKAAAALAQSGVPMAGSAFTAAGAGGAGSGGPGGAGGAGEAGGTGGGAEAPTLVDGGAPTAVLPASPPEGPRHVAAKGGPRWGLRVGVAAAAVVVALAVLGGLVWTRGGDDAVVSGGSALTSPETTGAAPDTGVRTAPGAEDSAVPADTTTRPPTASPSPSPSPTVGSARPRITSFAVESTGSADTNCPGGYVVAAWATTGATEVRLSVGSKTKVVEADGEDTLCASSGTAVTLRASGDGGEVSESRQVP